MFSGPKLSIFPIPFLTIKQNSAKFKYYTRCRAKDRMTKMLRGWAFFTSHKYTL